MPVFYLIQALASVATEVIVLIRVREGDGL
jgi:hypothetical protein